MALFHNDLWGGGGWEKGIANVKPQVVFKRPSSQYRFRIRKITKALTSQCRPFKVRNIIKSLRTSCSVRVPFHFPTLMAVTQTSWERQRLMLTWKRFSWQKIWSVPVFFLFFFFSLSLIWNFLLFDPSYVRYELFLPPAPAPSSFSLKMSGTCLCRYDFGEWMNIISLKSAQHVSQRH